MKYEYKCVKCEVKVIVDKPMSESSSVETCTMCDDTMERVYSVGGIVTGDGVK